MTALLLFGGETLKDFAFALLVGIVSGTYSSIFIASPVLTEWKEREPGYRQRRRRIIEELGYVPAYPVTTARRREAACRASERRDARKPARTAEPVERGSRLEALDEPRPTSRTAREATRQRQLELEEEAAAGRLRRRRRATPSASCAPSAQSARSSARAPAQGPRKHGRSR